MRSSFFHILSFLLLALLVLNCAPATPQQFAEIDQLQTQSNPEATIEQPIQVSNPAHLDSALTYVGITEATGNNDGPEIETFLASVGLAKGNPYCAAFVSYILEQTPNVKSPTMRTGLASKFINKDSINAKHVLNGTVEVPPGSIAIWRKGNTIFGHAGFVVSQSAANTFQTVEANTSPGIEGNQLDGDGIWQRERSIYPGNYFRITNFTTVQYNG